MTPRVLHIIPSLDRGGAEQQLALLAAGLPSAEFEMHVCCLTRGGPREQAVREAGVPVTVIGKRHKIDPFAYRNLEKHIKGLQPDIVQTWLFAANSYGRRAAIQAGVRRIVASERCVDRWKRWYHWAIDGRLAQRTDRIVVNSPGVQDFCVEHGLPAEKFCVIPNGVPAFHPPAAPSREALLDELHLPHDTLLIAAVGRLWPQKNYKDLIWAMCLLKEIRRDFQLLIFGEGPQRWRLERYRDQVHVDQQMRLLGERDDLARFWPHLDLFAQCSLYEGQSNALMEAMAAGLPVVATDIPGNQDLVVPEQTGYLVPAGDRAALGRWINVLLDDAPLRQRMGEAGRQRMQREFPVQNMVARYVDLYRELLT